MEGPSRINTLLKSIPFTFDWMVKELIGNPKTVLDLGCGRGELMSLLKKDGWKITGVDIFQKALNVAKKTGVYNQLIKGDVVKICKKLVSQKKKFDLVFASGIIEHLSRDEGMELLKLVEKLSKKRIYFNNPRDFMHQPEEYYLGNPHQEHKSGWSINDFSSRGYKVYGVGFYPVWSESGWARKGNRLVSFLSSCFSYSLAPLTFFLPWLSSGIMAVKVHKYPS